jgi:catechol 2,3-dioxygenase-like lactoylglutathione lyase family enzyme
MNEASSAGVVGIHTVGIPVSNQDNAIDFYVGVLGLEKRLDVPIGGDRRWIEVAPRGTATSIALVMASDAVPCGKETGIRLTTESADSAHSYLGGSGVDVDEVLRWPGVPPMFTFHDRDGNGLTMVQVSDS